jgi:hypothetical protein
LAGVFLHKKTIKALSCNIGSLPIFMGHVKGICEWRFMARQRGKEAIIQEIILCGVHGYIGDVGANPEKWFVKLDKILRHG